MSLSQLSFTDDRFLAALEGATGGSEPQPVVMSLSAYSQFEKRTRTVNPAAVTAAAAAIRSRQERAKPGEKKKRGRKSKAELMATGKMDVAERQTQAEVEAARAAMRKQRSRQGGRKEQEGAVDAAEEECQDPLMIAIRNQEDEEEDAKKKKKKTGRKRSREAAPSENGDDEDDDVDVDDAIIPGDEDEDQEVSYASSAAPAQTARNAARFVDGAMLQVPPPVSITKEVRSILHTAYAGTAKSQRRREYAGRIYCQYSALKLPIMVQGGGTDGRDKEKRVLFSKYAVTLQEAALLVRHLVPDTVSDDKRFNLMPPLQLDAIDVSTFRYLLCLMRIDSRDVCDSNLDELRCTLVPAYRRCIQGQLRARFKAAEDEGGWVGELEKTVYKSNVNKFHAMILEARTIESIAKNYVKWLRDCASGKYIKLRTACAIAHHLFCMDRRVKKAKAGAAAADADFRPLRAIYDMCAADREKTPAALDYRSDFNIQKKIYGLFRPVAARRNRYVPHVSNGINTSEDTVLRSESSVHGAFEASVSKAFDGEIEYGEPTVLGGRNGIKPSHRGNEQLRRTLTANAMNDMALFRFVGHCVMPMFKRLGQRPSMETDTHLRVGTLATVIGDVIDALRLCRRNRSWKKWARSKSEAGDGGAAKRRKTGPGDASAARRVSLQDVELEGDESEGEEQPESSSKRTRLDIVLHQPQPAEEIVVREEAAEERQEVESCASTSTTNPQNRQMMIDAYDFTTLLMMKCETELVSTHPGDWVLGTLNTVLTSVVGWTGKPMIPHSHYWLWLTSAHKKHQASAAAAAASSLPNKYLCRAGARSTEFVLRYESADDIAALERDLRSRGYGKFLDGQQG
jgi:hypothetical protein